MTFLIKKVDRAIHALETLSEQVALLSSAASSLVTFPSSSVHWSLGMTHCVCTDHTVSPPSPPAKPLNMLLPLPGSMPGPLPSLPGNPSSPFRMGSGKYLLFLYLLPIAQLILKPIISSTALPKHLFLPLHICCCWMITVFYFIFTTRL